MSCDSFNHTFPAKVDQFVYSRSPGFGHQRRLPIPKAEQWLVVAAFYVRYSCGAAPDFHRIP